MLRVRPAELEKLTSQQLIDVFHEFLAELDEEDLAPELGDYNMVVINQSKMALELGMQRPNVARAIKKLIEAGFLSQGPKAGHCRIYQVNRWVAWRDNEKNLAWNLAENRKRKLKAADPAERLKTRMKAAKITGIIETKEPDPTPR
jgi:hypothetical protein